MLLVFVLMLIVPFSDTSHFSGGRFQWEPTGNGLQVKISYRVSWRRTSVSCDDSSIASGVVKSQGSLRCVSGCSGTISVLKFVCTDYSSAKNWMTGTYTLLYTPPGRVFTFRYASCCWRDLAEGGDDWDMRITVNQNPRDDTGQINNSPTVEMPPVSFLKQGCTHTISIPVSDADGDVVRCRWATGSECSDVCQTVTGATLDQNTCVLTYNTVGRSLGYYIAAIQVEDFTNSSSTVALSSVSLQFMMSLESKSSAACGSWPVFVAPTPADNQCYIMGPGDTFTVNVTVQGIRPVSDIEKLSTRGMAFSSHETWNDGTYNYRSLVANWVPEQVDGGKLHRLCFSGKDSMDIYTPYFKCLRLRVSSCSQIHLPYVQGCVITIDDPSRPCTAYSSATVTCPDTDNYRLNCEPRGEWVVDCRDAPFPNLPGCTFALDPPYTTTISSTGTMTCAGNVRYTMSCHSNGQWESPIVYDFHCMTYRDSNTITLTVDMFQLEVDRLEFLNYTLATEKTGARIALAGSACRYAIDLTQSRIFRIETNLTNTGDCGVIINRTANTLQWALYSYDMADTYVIYSNATYIASGTCKLTDLPLSEAITQRSWNFYGTSIPTVQRYMQFGLQDRRTFNGRRTYSAGAKVELGALVFIYVCIFKTWPRTANTSPYGLYVHSCSAANNVNFDNTGTNYVSTIVNTHGCNNASVDAVHNRAFWLQDTFKAEESMYYNNPFCQTSGGFEAARWATITKDKIYIRCHVDFCSNIEIFANSRCRDSCGKYPNVDRTRRNADDQTMVVETSFQFTSTDTRTESDDTPVCVETWLAVLTLAGLTALLMATFVVTVALFRKIMQNMARCSYAKGSSS